MGINRIDECPAARMDDFNSCTLYGMQQVPSDMLREITPFQLMHPIRDATFIETDSALMWSFQLMHPIGDVTP